MDLSQLPLFDEVDVVQVGARKHAELELLKELGRGKKTVLLKRGLANTLQELLMSAEYIMSAGTGTSSYASAASGHSKPSPQHPGPVGRTGPQGALASSSNRDPSHATGLARMGAAHGPCRGAAGADGLMIEVHNKPFPRSCDGPQSITPSQFKALAGRIMGRAGHARRG